MPLVAATKMTLSHLQRIINPIDTHRSSGESALRAADGHCQALGNRPGELLSGMEAVGFDC
jgi:hypothetical protein